MRTCHGCQADVPDESEACPRCGNPVSRGLLASIARLFRSKPDAPKPTLARAASPFKLKVEDVFSITGRGTVVTGKVSSGEVRVGDEVRFENKRGSQTTTHVTGIETFRKLVDVGRIGDDVGLLLRKVTADDIGVGTTIESA